MRRYRRKIRRFNPLLALLGKIVARAAKFKCQKCGSKENLKLHEKDKTIGYYIDNLLLLCSICHDMEHGKFIFKEVI